VLKNFILLLFIVFVHVSMSHALAAEEKEKKTEETKAPPATSDAKKTTNTRPITPEPISVGKQHKADLKHYLANEIITPILAGPNDYLTIITPQTSVNTKGVAILLPDWQQGVTSHHALNFLRTKLPHQGWTTIAIQPPMKPNNYPSLALTSEDQKKENKETLETYQLKLSALIKEVMIKAKDYPGIVIIIAQGQHGAMLTNLYQTQKNEAPSALILLSSYVNTNASFINSANLHFANNIALSDYPILDLYLKHDHLLTINKAQERRAQAKQEMNVYYRQRQINNYHAGNYPEQSLLIEINSWLKAIGW
jgi:hypothetical protein